MNDLEKLLLSTRNLSSEIEEILKQSTYVKSDDLSYLNINYNNADQVFLLDGLRSIMEKLDNVKDAIDYLNKPITHIGTLRKNVDGRYETEYREYTSGSGIEVSVYDDFDEKDCWIKTRVEHDGKDYYLVGYKNIPMQGLSVRIRG